MITYSRLLKNLGKPYMRGEDVRAVQRQLIALGYLAKGEDDSYYGPITAEAVYQYQKAKGLKRDRIVGVITWGSLFPVQTAPKADTIQDKLCAHAALAVEQGSIYVLGAQGQTGTAINEPWIKKREHNKAVEYNRVIKFWKKQLAAGFIDLHAYDCSGLIMYLLIKEGYTKTDTNANGIYTKLCDAINRADLQAGDVVWKKGHIGIYMGDGTVIHAKGRDVGVVRETINAVKWTGYGRLK